ncbi:MAG: hypothetical protein J7647_19175 [Cyanobacteria bacterium SBLK]|nr:hypothetical protein [Cyanobacteria bacterium SBLK]
MRFISPKRHLIDRLDELEDVVWGKQAIDAETRSPLVGEKDFMALQALVKIAIAKFPNPFQWI